MKTAKDVVTQLQVHLIESHNAYLLVSWLSPLVNDKNSSYAQTYDNEADLDFTHRTLSYLFCFAG